MYCYTEISSITNPEKGLRKSASLEIIFLYAIRYPKQYFQCVFVYTISQSNLFLLDKTLNYSKIQPLSHPRFSPYQQLARCEPFLGCPSIFVYFIDVVKERKNIHIILYIKSVSFNFSASELSMIVSFIVVCLSLQCLMPTLTLD